MTPVPVDQPEEREAVERWLARLVALTLNLPMPNATEADVDTVMTAIEDLLAQPAPVPSSAVLILLSAVVYLIEHVSDTGSLLVAGQRLDRTSLGYWLLTSRVP